MNYLFFFFCSLLILVQIETFFFLLLHSYHWLLPEADVERQGCKCSQFIWKMIPRNTNREGDGEWNSAHNGGKIKQCGPREPNPTAELRSCAWRTFQSYFTWRQDAQVFTQRQPSLTGWGLLLGRSINLITLLPSVRLGGAGFSHQRKPWAKSCVWWYSPSGYGQGTTSWAVIPVTIFALGFIFFRQSNKIRPTRG